MVRFFTIAGVAVFLALALPGPAQGAMAVVQKAAEASLKCGCTVRMTGGKIRVVVKSVSKAWQQNGKNCRTLRITVFEGDKLLYNGIQKVCEP